MQIQSSKLFGLLLIFLCLNSLVYHSQINNSIENFDEITDNNFTDNYDNEGNSEINSTNNEKNPPMKDIKTPGNFQTKAYFFYNTYLNIDDDGLGWELEEYEVMKDDGANSLEIRPRFDSTDQQGLDHTWPPDTTNYHEFTSPYSPYSKSHFFTPVFDEETYISGKIYFVNHIKNSWDEGYPTIDYRIRVFSFNPADNSSSLICTIEDNGINSYLSSSDQRVYSATLPSTYTIPLGHRIKIKLDGKISTLDETGEFKFYLSDHDPGNTYTWDINDNEYSSTYSITDVHRIFGVQFYMNNDYPDINVAGFTNNTKYYERKNVSLSVSGAVSSSYRWDEDSWTSFDTTNWTWSPEIHGWHYLYVQAIDDHNNNITSIYRIGFDESPVNIVLNNFSNGSFIGDTSELSFDPYSISYALYEWDKDGDIRNLTQESYLIAPPSVEGVHNLSITTYDMFETTEFFYIFTVDSSAPEISLLNVLNDTTQPAGKVIDVNITDSSSLEVFYKWDTQDNLPWSPFSGTIYRTYLPSSDGAHILIVSANDTFGHFISKKYVFVTDDSVLGVELQNLINNSYYYGGNNVNLTITGSNTTVYYMWDNGVEKEVTLTESYLLLTGDDALPSTIGIHNLTIRTFNISNIESIFVFYFYIDQEAPIIDPSIYDYNNSRFLTSDTFTFIFSDNNVSETDLLVFYSIDGGENQTLLYPFTLYLSFFIDGTYTLTLYVFDIANNVAIASIIFTIDMTPPTISSVDIEGLIQVLGTNYVPADSLVTVSILDDDSLINSSYSWGGFTYFAFTNSFVLSYPDGGSTLFINASDSLDNTIMYSLDLIIDSQAPVITIVSPSNETKINHDTKLEFLVDDIQIYTIYEVESSWDKFYPASSPVSFDSLGIFELMLYSGYDEYDLFALLYLFTTDVVGNSEIYIFNFTIDLIAPLAALYINDTDSGEYKDASEFQYVQGNTSIWYDASKNNDLNSFTYYWDNNKEAQKQLLLADPFIYIPTQDGYHNLTVILEDDTMGSYPNTNVSFYVFFIDDIHIDFLNPVDLDTTTHQLIYGDEFEFTISVYDIYSATAIPDLTWNQTSFEISNNLNLVLSNTTINNKTFQFTIFCNNVSETSLVFDFYAGESSHHIFTVSLSIIKKEGSITILEDSDLYAVYEEDIFVNITLNDENGFNQSIIAIYVNGSEKTEFENLGNNVYQFSYSSYDTSGKGNYVLEIMVESLYYFGRTNSSYLLEFEVATIPTILQVFVSEYNVTYGNNLIISSLITFVNGTPIEDLDIIFYVYVYYRNNTQAVFAFTDYDSYEILSGNTNSTGFATVTFEVTEDMNYICISAEYGGSPFYGDFSLEFNEFIRAIRPPGLPTNILYLILAGTVTLLAIISYVIFKLVRKKPFEKLMEEIEEEEIINSLPELSPGVILTIFDQKKGPIPLVSEHSLNLQPYTGRFVVGLENFLLKIADQAYSSLGFEESHERRRIGSIILPSERMIGFIHGIQLENKAARGGFENLALIVLTNEQHDNALLGNQVHLYDEIDVLISFLKEKASVEEINKQLILIRKLSTRIILAASKMDKELLEQNNL